MKTEELRPQQTHRRAAMLAKKERWRVDRRWKTQRIKPITGKKIVIYDAEEWKSYNHPVLATVWLFDRL